jgi:hypothetical protein
VRREGYSCKTVSYKNDKYGEAGKLGINNCLKAEDAEMTEPLSFLTKGNETSLCNVSRGEQREFAAVVT